MDDGGDMRAFCEHPTSRPDPTNLMTRYLPTFLLLLLLILFASILLYGADLNHASAQTTGEDYALLQEQPLRITRGPYLQLGTPDSILIRWRTNLPTTSAVQFGLNAEAMTNNITASQVVTEHVIAINNLVPETTYFYTVGAITQTLTSPNANHYFVTAPPVGQRTPTRIWVLGDSGYAPTAQRVRDAYYRYTGNRRTDVMLMVGDNAYPYGTDEEFQTGLFDVFADTIDKTTLWPALGNHDTHNADVASQTGPYFDVFSLPTQGEAGGIPSGTEAYYSFDYGNIHFICLDSVKSIWWPLGPQPMIDWLYNDLQSTHQDWIIAYWHHPPYSKGKHDSDTESGSIRMRERILPLLENAGVDLVLSGHSHSYERSYLIDGHYGTSGTFEEDMILNHTSGDPGIDRAYYKTKHPHKGAVYVVAGTSGAALRDGAFDHPVMYTHQLKYGSVVIDVVENVLSLAFLDDNGIVQDRFSLYKSMPHGSPTPSPTFTPTATPIPTATPATIYLPVLFAKG